MSGVIILEIFGPDPSLRPSPFFFVQRRMSFPILGRSVGLKKKKAKKKSQEVSEKEAPVTQDDVKS